MDHDRDHHHGEHDHDHDHDHEHEHEEAEVDASAWFRSAQTLSCPACGAAGAVMLGGGVFCPTCGEVSKSPGFQSPAT